ncbi:RNA polymerase sigma factor [Hyphococcus sp.]|uniref:RNA polymerase sigma factor n=1 Tax=Hyphococcus sp. TaxID=2038636 RepID=UPI0035C6A9C5
MADQDEKKERTDGGSGWFLAHVHRHSAALKRYLLQLSRSPHEAEEIEQEAYLRVYEAQRGQDIENPRAFLFRTAHNLFIQRYRKNRNSPIEAVEDVDALSVKDMCAAADDLLVARERLGALAEAIDRLPPQARRVFIMRKVYNLSHKEISDVLGIAPSTIEKHVGRGIVACRDFLTRHDAGENVHDDGYDDRDSASSGADKRGGRS